MNTTTETDAALALKRKRQLTELRHAAEAMLEHLATDPPESHGANCLVAARLTRAVEDAQ